MSTQILTVQRDDGFLRKKWTVAECRRMTESGLLEPGKFELIEGEIVSKMGQSRLHIYVAAQVENALKAIFGVDHVQTSAQIGIGEVDEFSDPEPDVVVLSGTLRDYLVREPDPATEVRLVVEVSNSTLVGDLGIKSKIYARNGVPEYWVVAIARREIVVFRSPSSEGYAEVLTSSHDGFVSPLAAPDQAVRVSEMLP